MRLCQAFSPVALNVPAAAQNHSRPQAAKETLQEYIQRFTDFMICATCVDPTSVTCQVTIILFIRQLFNKEIKKLVAAAKNIETLRHASALAQDTAIKRKSMKV